MDDLISIIIPIYKVENLLERCVDSILRQTYDNIEIILVDDGSPDRCGEICDQYEIKDSRIKVIHKKNGGLSDARNAGIDVAKGEYITFIDSDDWVSEKYVKTLYDLLVSKSADISVCNFIRTEKEEIETSNEQNELYEFNNIEALTNLCGEFYQRLTVSWCKLYKTELFADIRFPVGKIHEDEFTTYKLLYKAKKIALTNEVLLYYWQRPDSIMGTSFKIKNRLHAIEAFQERADFFESIGETTLRDKTYRALFGIYSEVNDNLKYFQDQSEKNLFVNSFKNHILKLNKTNQALFFRIFYKTYYKLPRLTKRMYYLYKGLGA